MTPPHEPRGKAKSISGYTAQGFSFTYGCRKFTYGCGNVIGRMVDFQCYGVAGGPNSAYDDNAMHVPLQHISTQGRWYRVQTVDLATDSSVL